MAYHVRVDGLREFISAADAAGKETKKAVRKALREVGGIVKNDARARFASTDARTAGRFGVSVRKTGMVSVEQRLRKTTGKHPDFGALQMRRALVPALEAKRGEVEKGLEEAVDRLINQYGF